MKRERRGWCALRLLAAVLLLGCGFGVRNGETKGETVMSTWFLTYKRPLAPPTYLSIVLARRAYLMTITGPISGVDLPGVAEIGTYAGDCPADEEDNLRALAASAVRAGSAPIGDAPRGARFLTIGTGPGAKDDLEAMVSFPLGRPMPAEIQRLDSAMVKVARRLLEHPFATLRATMDCTPARLRARDLLLVVGLDLAASGRSAVEIKNPVVAQDDETTPVSLVLKSKRGDVSVMDLKGGEVEPADPAGSKSETVSLAPDEKLRLRLTARRHIYLPPGTYEVSARYRSDVGGIPETKAVEGMLQTSACRVTVTKD